MSAWEAANPGLLELASIRGFFGAPNVASGKLSKKTSIHYVPAVADAGEETFGAKKSPIINLLSEIERQVYENQREVVDFISRSQTEFSDLVNPDRFPQLASISERLTSTVQRYYRDSKLMADWESKDGLKVSFPQPSLRIEDNGFVSGLENVGHVLQRAALFSVIEFLASKIENDTEGEGFDRAQSDIVLLVKEPEIYQHSSKQQVIHDAFHQTCKDFSAESGIRFQVVFSTHSEKFIGMNKFHSARILRRATVDGEEQHGCASVSVARASRFFAEALNRDPLSDASFESKMHIFSREICEGFFARKVVLVEGVSDRAVLEAVYRAVGRHPEAEGIAIISVDGKTKMDKPLFVFNSLGIPAFAVFDSEQSKADKKQKINANIIIQKVLGVAQPIDFPDGCFEKFASFSENMETHLKGLSAEAWEREVQIYKEEFGFDSDDICKTPWVAQQICGKLVEGGVELARFQRIIDSVDAL